MEAKTRFWRLRHLKGAPKAGAMVHSSNRLRQLGRNLRRDQGPMHHVSIIILPYDE